VWLVRRDTKRDAEAHAVTSKADLPKVKLTKEDAEKITKWQIKAKDKGEVTLEKKGDKWELTLPLAAPASKSNVDSLVSGVQSFEVQSLISEGTEQYAKNELDDASATHVVAFKGEEKALEMWFGKSGSRGQMARIAGKDAVYAVKGYSSYTFVREVKNWRENEILKFEEDNAIQTEVENAHGKFSFTKEGDKWSATFYARDEKKGTLAATGKAIERFDDGKLKELLRAFKNLRATDFGDDKSDAGLDDPVKHGGTVYVKLKDNAGELKLKIGKTEKGSNRFFSKEGDPTPYVITSWAADWATANVDKFQKPEEKKDDKDKDKKDDGKKDDGKADDDLDLGGD
jgi:hypothetical protein